MVAIEWLLGAILDFGDLVSRRKREAGAALVALVLLVSPDTFVRVAHARAESMMNALISSLPVPTPVTSAPAEGPEQPDQ